MGWKDNLYDKLSGVVNDREGEPVLVIGTKMDPFIHYALAPSFFPLDSSIERFSLNLGILRGDLFRVGNDFVLPTQKYSHKDSFHPFWSKKEGDIKLRGSQELVYLHGNFFPDDSPLGLTSSEDTEIFVGEDIVGYFFQKKDFLNGRDLSYARGLQLLGASLSESLAEEYREHCILKGLELFGKIEGLENKGKNLQARIEKVCEMSRSGDSSYVENGALHFVGKDDSFWATFGEREQLEDSKRSIQSSLLDAVHLGLHEFFYSFSLKPGVSVDMQKYVLGMCESYGVEISDEFCSS